MCAVGRGTSGRPLCTRGPGGGGVSDPHPPLLLQGRRQPRRPCAAGGAGGPATGLGQPAGPRVPGLPRRQ
eukprot:11674011-Alexandrium_andersonii.AAC.1